MRLPLKLVQPWTLMEINKSLVNNMTKDVEHTFHEEGLVREIDIGGIYNCLSFKKKVIPPTSFTHRTTS